MDTHTRTPGAPAFFVGKMCGSMSWFQPEGVVVACAVLSAVFIIVHRTAHSNKTREAGAVAGASTTIADGAPRGHGERGEAGHKHGDAGIDEPGKSHIRCPSRASAA